MAAQQDYDHLKETDFSANIVLLNDLINGSKKSLSLSIREASGTGMILLHVSPILSCSPFID